MEDGCGAGSGVKEAERGSVFLADGSSVCRKRRRKERKKKKEKNARREATRAGETSAASHSHANSLATLIFSAVLFVPAGTRTAVGGDQRHAG